MVELIWDGKYKDGKRVQPVRVALPFQTIETVNESAQERQKMLDFFSAGRDSDWRNRLIWGDKKYVLPSLLAEFAGKVNLIYIDPPFATGANFSFTASIPDDPDLEGDQGATFTKQPSMIEEKAYRDTWGKGLDSFMQWFYETITLLKDLLTEDGSIYVHLDDNIGQYAKVILDENFGIQNYRSEVIWQRTDSHNDAKNQFGNIHDNIFWYSKSEKITYNFDDVRTNLSESGLSEYSLLELPDGSIVNFKGNENLKGRRLKLDDATWRGTSAKKKFTWRGATPSPNREWMYSFEEMEAALARGELFLRDSTKGSARCKKSYLDLNKGILLQDIWTDAGRMKGGSEYPTQKPEPLLERIIKASSNPGDLVLDCFCGSGTTAAVAEKLGRRWITCDLGRFAIHTARKRFLGIAGVKPFVVQNLGKYERQAWQTSEWENLETARARESAYRNFILELYGATVISSGVYLHGLKSGRMVHVGSVDAPVTINDVKAIARELLARVGTGAEAPSTAGVDILGWDFVFEINETGKDIARDAGVDVKFKKIPHNVLEKKAVEQGDIKFFELAALSVQHKLEKRKLSLALTDFIVAPDDVPADIMGAITNWSQWVDYWAVDFNFRGDTFHNEWQTYRTRKNPKLELKTVHTFEEPGSYTVLVKVIDLLGNDTTKSFSLEVK